LFYDFVNVIRKSQSVLRYCLGIDREYVCGWRRATTKCNLSTKMVYYRSRLLVYSIVQVHAYKKSPISV